MAGVNHSIRQGASTAETVDGPAHRALDRAIPRAGDPVEGGGLEHTVRQIRDPAVPERIIGEDVTMLDPLPAPHTRPSRFPIVQTIRRGAFTDHPLLGNRLPLLRAAAAAAPQQQMEPSPTARRNTFRITPIPWDEQAIEGNEQ